MAPAKVPCLPPGACCVVILSLPEDLIPYRRRTLTITLTIDVASGLTPEAWKLET